MKNKDVANLREEVSDYETRFTAKSNELRSVKTQLQVMQQRYEEAMQEIDNLQSGGVSSSLRADQRRLNGEFERATQEISSLKAENARLLENIKELKLSAVRNSLNQSGAKYAGNIGAANQGVDDLVAHFENFNMEDLGATGSPLLHRSMTERNNLSPQRQY